MTAAETAERRARQSEALLRMLTALLRSLPIGQRVELGGSLRATVRTDGVIMLRGASSTTPFAGNAGACAAEILRRVQA